MSEQQSLQTASPPDQSVQVQVAEKPSPEPATAQQLRVVEVNEALLPAYQKASTLELTDEEIANLTAPFPDEMVEIRGHDGLIFVPHIHVSDRLNKVFKPGKWALIRRRDWFDQSSNTMFGEYVLLIRGCFVGESVGGHPFQPNNPKTNLSDVLESTAAEALRRIAGKRLSCGSQVWNPEYARQWVHKYATKANGKWERRFPSSDTHQPAKPSPAASQTPRKATPDDVLPKGASPKTREWMLNGIYALGGFNGQEVIEFARAKGFVAPDATDETWKLEHVPTTKDGLNQLISDIGRWLEGSEPPPDMPEDELPSDIANVPIHVPPRGVTKKEYEKSGMDTIGSLYARRHDDEKARNRLFGFMEKFEASGWTKDDGTKMPPSKEDIALRAALDKLADFISAKEGK